LTQAEQLLLAPQTGAEQAFVTRQDREITGFLIAYPGPVPNVVDIVGGYDPSYPDPTAHVQALLATAGEYRSVAIDIDNSTTVIKQLADKVIESVTAIVVHKSIICNIVTYL